MNELIWAEISLSALKNNLAIARQAAKNSKIMAVIKSDAYGHGAVESAKALGAADAFAVARIDEAIQLRNHGITNSIVILSGITTGEDIELSIQYQLQPVIHSNEGIKLLTLFHSDSRLPVWLKIDTGMHRLGLQPDNFKQAIETVGNLKNIELQGVLSHLSDAENIPAAKNIQQQRIFNALCVESRIETRSMSNSAGILFHEQMHYEWVRPGIMLYGENPSETENELTRQLQPVMAFKSRVINMKRVMPGEKVGYNGTWEATENCTIATIAAGYGDGYPRHAKNGTPVLIKGKRYPLAGRVSMDMITVNVGNDEIQVGDMATLWGEGLPAKTIANAAETITYELFCGITPRVKRIYTDQA